MSAFRFSLEKVLELRKRTEEESARHLATARREADEARRARQALEEARNAGFDKLTRAHGAGGAVGHLQNLMYVLAKVDEQIREADAACRRAEEAVAERMRCYHDALRHRKTLDQLREKHLEAWKSEEAREEQKTMDEIALARHGRTGGVTPTESE